jgi:hypothetical protein
MYYEHISKMLLRIFKEKIGKKDDRVKIIIGLKVLAVHS